MLNKTYYFNTFQILKAIPASPFMSQFNNSIPTLEDIGGKIRNQTGIQNPKNPEKVVDRIREELCVSGNRQEWILILDNRDRQNELVDALCNLTRTQFEELIEDIEEDMDAFKALPQINRCAKDALGKKIHFNEETQNNLQDLQKDVSCIVRLVSKFINIFVDID